MEVKSSVYHASYQERVPVLQKGRKLTGKAPLTFKLVQLIFPFLIHISINPSYYSTMHTKKESPTINYQETEKIYVS